MLEQKIVLIKSAADVLVHAALTNKQTNIIWSLTEIHLILYEILQERRLICSLREPVSHFAYLHFMLSDKRLLNLTEAQNFSSCIQKITNVSCLIHFR